MSTDVRCINQIKGYARSASVGKAVYTDEKKQLVRFLRGTFAEESLRKNKAQKFSEMSSYFTAIARLAAVKTVSTLIARACRKPMSMIVLELSLVGSVLDGGQIARPNRKPPPPTPDVLPKNSSANQPYPLNC